MKEFEDLKHLQHCEVFHSQMLHRMAQPEGLKILSSVNGGQWHLNSFSSLRWKNTPLHEYCGVWKSVWQQWREVSATPAQILAYRGQKHCLIPTGGWPCWKHAFRHSLSWVGQQIWKLACGLLRTASKPFLARVKESKLNVHLLLMSSVILKRSWGVNLLHGIGTCGMNDWKCFLTQQRGVVASCWCDGTFQ